MSDVIGRVDPQIRGEKAKGYRARSNLMAKHGEISQNADHHRDFGISLCPSCGEKSGPAGPCFKTRITISVFRFHRSHVSCCYPGMCLPFYGDGFFLFLYDFFYLLARLKFTPTSKPQSHEREKTWGSNTRRDNPTASFSPKHAGLFSFEMGTMTHIGSTFHIRCLSQRVLKVLFVTFYHRHVFSGQSTFHQ